MFLVKGDMHSESRRQHVHYSTKIDGTYGIIGGDEVYARIVISLH